MVYRATIVVKTVCAKELWIRSMHVVNMRCHARIAGLMAEISLAIMVDRRQMLAAVWRPRIADVLTSQATLGH